LRAKDLLFKVLNRGIAGPKIGQLLHYGFISVKKTGFIHARRFRFGESLPEKRSIRQFCFQMLGVQSKIV